MRRFLRRLMASRRRRQTLVALHLSPVLALELP
jgi:hypothetical protein